MDECKPLLGGGGGGGGGSLYSNSMYSNSNYGKSLYYGMDVGVSAMTAGAQGSATTQGAPGQPLKADWNWDEMFNV